MTIPTTREEFKKTCLEKLGWPVIEINVSDEQIDNCVDEALRYFAEFHYDGSEKIYYKYQITDTDKTNGYLTMPAGYLGVVNLFPVAGMYSSEGLFDVRYQLVLNDLLSLSNVDILPYYSNMMHISFIEEVLVGQQPIRFSRYNRRLYIDTAWTSLLTGQYLVVEAYKIVDPTTNSDIWADTWLQRFTATLIKEVWGEILSKFQGIPMSGGMVLNWQDIKKEAKEEKAAYLDQLHQTYSIPSQIFIG